jgi:D-arabinan exo alpha-(1,3)/(1,5)-arabinofuranosidase (non-reducing end)
MKAKADAIILLMTIVGLTHWDKQDNSFSGYCFHEDAPVFFQNGLRLTCRCGETLNGETLHDPPAAEYTTYVWLYRW